MSNHCAGSCQCGQAAAASSKGDAPSPPPQATLVYHVAGLCCGEEVAAIQRELSAVLKRPMESVAALLSFDLLNKRVTVLDHSLSPQDLQIAFDKAGLSATPWTAKTRFVDARYRRRLVILAAASGAACAVGAGLSAFGPNGAEVEAITRLCYGLAIVLGLWLVIPKAVRAIRQRRPDMNLLMCLAVAGAIFLGDWLEAATVSCLFALSLALESWSAGRASQAIAALLDLSPPVVRVKDDQTNIIEMPPVSVPIGAVFIVKPGERIALDGRVIAGNSAVNQAPMTGESRPIHKNIGDMVYAGTINGDGALEIENLKSAQDTTLAQITRLVTEAQNRRSNAQRWVDRFAALYTPLVIVLAAAMMLVPPLVFSGPWDEWFYRGLVVLVIACPCALVISTPVTVVSAMAAAARAGILVRGGEFLELPSRLQTVVFDKTGTLTTGHLTVQQILCYQTAYDADHLLTMAAALESRSSHPIALAIVRTASQRSLPILPADAVQQRPGLGITGTVQGHSVWLGAPSFAQSFATLSVEQNSAVADMADQGQTVLILGSGAQIWGVIGLSDQIRPDAAAALQALRQAGIKHLVLATGDHPATARQIAAQLPLDRVHAALMPEDKVRVIEALKAEFGPVAMVGDGINDAPAMAAASMGIAMGQIGSDIAIETADVSLMSDHLGALAWMVRHSYAMRSVMAQNIAIALGVKLVFAALAVTGSASLWGAIAADTGTSLLVIINALRMLWRQ